MLELGSPPTGIAWDDVTWIVLIRMSTIFLYSPQGEYYGIILSEYLKYKILKECCLL